MIIFFPRTVCSIKRIAIFIVIFQPELAKDIRETGCKLDGAKISSIETKS